MEVFPNPGWIALLIAITSPVLTSIINNKHVRKMKELEYKRESESQRSKSQEEYLSWAAMALLESDEESERSYYQSLSKAYLYFPKEDWPHIEALDKLIRKEITDESLQNEHDGLDLINLLSKNLVAGKEHPKTKKLKQKHPNSV